MEAGASKQVKSVSPDRSRVLHRRMELETHPMGSQMLLSMTYRVQNYTVF